MKREQGRKGGKTFRPPSSAPVFLVISGPSGVGKDAVVSGLKKALPSAHFVITATTRPPRPGERDGVDYHFLTNDQYGRLLAEDGFLEHASVYRQRSGVPRKEVEAALQNGQDVVVRVDVQGAASIKRLIPDAVLIFLEPGSQEELEKRLRERSTHQGAELRSRLDTFRREMAQEDAFDHIVVNVEGRLDNTVAQIASIVEAERRRRMHRTS